MTRTTKRPPSIAMAPRACTSRAIRERGFSVRRGLAVYEGKLPLLRDTDPVVGPAPPAYDPGGLTALALEMRDPADAPTFALWASASNAILAIVPARSSDSALEEALAAAGYEPASDWFTKNI